MRRRFVVDPYLALALFTIALGLLVHWRGGALGLSTQDTGYQSEAVERLHLPFPILSDCNLTLARAIKLPTFAAAGMRLLKRMVLVIDDGIIVKVFYPIFPPDKSADEVIAWLLASR